MKTKVAKPLNTKHLLCFTLLGNPKQNQAIKKNQGLGNLQKVKSEK